MAGGEDRRRGQGDRSGGRHLRPREKMMFDLREKVLFHAPLSQFRVPRMKIQTPSPQEMKGHPGVSVQHRRSWRQRGLAEKGLSVKGRGIWGRKRTDNPTLT